MNQKVRLHYPLLEGVILIEESNNTVVIVAVFSITDVSKFGALGYSL